MALLNEVLEEIKRQSDEISLPLASELTAIKRGTLWYKVNDGRIPCSIGKRGKYRSIRLRKDTVRQLALKNMAAINGWLTISELVEEFGISRSQLKAMCEEGILRAEKDCCGGWRIDPYEKEKLEQYFTNLPGYIGLPEVAELVGGKYNTFYKIVVIDRKIPFVEKRGRIYTNIEDVVKWRRDADIKDTIRWREGHEDEIGERMGSLREHTAIVKFLSYVPEKELEKCVAFFHQMEEHSYFTSFLEILEERVSIIQNNERLGFNQNVGLTDLRYYLVRAKSSSSQRL